MTAYAGTALLAASLTLAPTPASADESPDTEGLDQTVDPQEESVEGEAVLSVGHVDIGPRFLDGEWRIHGRDDSQVPPVWRLLTDVVTHVSDASLQPAPDDEEFDFLRAEPGDDVYVIPQTQATDVVWLGWNTQDPEVMDRVNRGVTLSMLGAEGPGHFSVFLQDGAFGPPDVLWDSAVEGRQDLWVDVNTHTHANWVFTEPGVYAIDFEVSADLITGENVSDRASLRFAVGDATDVDDAFALPATHQESAAQSEEDTAQHPVESGRQSSPPGEQEESTATASLGAPLGIAAGVVVVLLAALGLVTARTRRARRLAGDGSTPEDTTTGGAR